MTRICVRKCYRRGSAVSIALCYRYEIARLTRRGERRASYEIETGAAIRQ